mgnify:CR=1 FL=1
MKINILGIRKNDLKKHLFIIFTLSLFACSNIYKIQENQIDCFQELEGIYLKFNDSFLSVDTSSKNILASIERSKQGDSFKPIIKFSYHLIDHIIIDNEVIQCGGHFDFGVMSIDDSIKVYLVNNNVEVEYLMTFTFLPIVSISSQQMIKDEPKILSNIYLSNIHGQDYNNLMGGIEIRGASSQNYAKKSYDIEFWEDKDGNKNTNHSFFHMRNDDDWILDAMYIDLSKVRNLTGMFVCSLITTNRNSYLLTNQKLYQSGELIELNVNNNYAGIYALNEQIDKKQLTLGNQSFIYKSENYTEETLMEGISSLPSNSHLWNGFELKYPNYDNVQNWDKIYNLVAEVAYSSDSSFSSNIIEMINFDNLIDFWIIINITQAIDNMGKNNFIFCNSKNEPLMFSVWDLDLTFGNQAFYVSLPIDQILSNALIDRLISLNVNNFNSLLQSRWNELNHQELHEKVIVYCTKKISQIKSSSADLREQNRWVSNLNLDIELNYINSWLLARLEILDNYVSSIM